MTRLNMSRVCILGQHPSTTKDILLGVWQGLGSAALVESEVGIAEHDGQGRQGDLNNSCIIKRLDKAFAYDQGKEVHVVFIVYDILSIWHIGQRMKTQLKAQGLKKRLAEGNWERTILLTNHRQTKILKRNQQASILVTSAAWRFTRSFTDTRKAIIFFTIFETR